MFFFHIFFFLFIIIILAFRPCRTHDWHAEDETVNTLLRTRSRPASLIVTYARLDLRAADPSDSATSLVINEKQLYRILYKDII